MLMADSSTRFSSISIFPASERRRKWPSASIAEGIRVCVTLAPESDFARSAVGRERPDVQWKAAAFARWHEQYDARVSSPVL
jgi:hypothetical protein